ncbi:MAG: Rieske 2Fe-2S domain-containing protein [Acidobacteria bacterium]|nr:Rieske 2Fe-2S domain-containing protein [Acidobacteriota bacterium]
MRTLIGAIGYRNLRDHSAAFEVIERLSGEDLGTNVVVEDVSYNPIALVQWLDEQEPEARFERIVFVSAVQRAVRPPGAVTCYQWSRALPSDELIQQAITEAVTGIISLDNTIVIAGYFGARGTCGRCRHHPRSRSGARRPPSDEMGKSWPNRRARNASMSEPKPEVGEPSRDLLSEVERLIAELQGSHGARVCEHVTQLLQDIDAIHRAGLTHLMDAIRGMAGDAFVNKLVADPAIRMLLMSYDLVAVDRRLQAEEALDTARGHLHAHGIDVEILEVVGGVVYVRLHGLEAERMSEQAVRRDIEEVLKEGFIGFQELVTRERQSSPVTIPVGWRRSHKPVYRDVLDADALRAGEMKGLEVDGRQVLVIRAGDEEWLAVANRCGGSPLPLEFGRLDGTTLHCSWHGCQYDLRMGTRLDAAGDRLTVFPVNVENGKVRIAIDVENA